MKIYTLTHRQTLPITLEQAWAFFSDPLNLEKITPPWLDFKVHSPLPSAMYAGLVVQYHVHPVARIPICWTTEITHVRQPYFFVDEQRFGPYRFWHHQHLFTQTDDGIEMTDIVHYALPFGLLGRCFHPWFVRRKLEKIFSFRRQRLEELFNRTDGVDALLR